VIVDLSAVTFIDSSGLATLADAHKRIRHAGGQLAIDRVLKRGLRLAEVALQQAHSG